MMKSMRGSRQLSVRCRASGAGKNVLITGGNTGIGFETAKDLCTKGYSVTIACRDDQKASDAVARIKSAVPGAQVGCIQLDLANLSSVYDCAKSVSDSGVQYDVLLNNAGVMACPKMSTKDGFEYQLGINHLGHFAFTTALLPYLKSSKKPVRIVNVASAAHAFGRVDFNDLMRDKSYSEWDAYGQSKLANVMFTYELARKLTPADNITATCLHPGVVATELGRYMINDSNRWYMGPMLEVAKMMFIKTPVQGAQTSIYLCSSPAVEGVTGKFYQECKEFPSAPQSYDIATAKKLWEVSEELVKVPASITA